MQIKKFVFGRVEKIEEKRESVGYRHFLLISTMFSKFVKTWDIIVKGKIPDHKISDGYVCIESNFGRQKSTRLIRLGFSLKR